MANLTLWYKTVGTQNLGTVPDTQKILFDGEKKGIEVYEWSDWQTNIKATSNSNRTGVRNVNMEDAGFEGCIIILKGEIHESSTVTQEIANLFNFLKILQTPDALPAGAFCIDNPNGPAMSIIATKAGVGGATKSKGISIMRGSSVKWNQTNKSYDFLFRMIYGGDLT